MTQPSNEQPISAILMLSLPPSRSSLSLHFFTVHCTLPYYKVLLFSVFSSLLELDFWCSGGWRRTGVAYRGHVVVPLDK